MKLWSTLLCRFGRHRMTNWRRVPSLSLMEKHCKREGCAYQERRVMTKRTPILQRRELAEAKEAETRG